MTCGYGLYNYTHNNYIRPLQQTNIPTDNRGVIREPSDLLYLGHVGLQISQMFVDATPNKLVDVPEALDNGAVLRVTIKSHY